jgi:hypothetical protein
MSHLAIHRHQIILQPESARVIIRPFIPSSARRLATIIGRALALTEEEVEKEETRTYADSSDSTADYVALEPGLEKLNTGILASTADWFKSVRGKQLTYDFYLFLKVGNAYARLRCYIDQARDLLNDPERLTYVQRARNLFKRTPPPASTEPTFSAPGSNSTQQQAAASLQLSGPPSSSSVNASAESDPHEDLLQAILEGDTSKVGEIFQSNRDLTPNNPLVIPPSSPYRDEYYGDTSLRVAVKNDNVPMAK